MTTQPGSSTPAADGYTGQVVYLYAFDIAHEIPTLPATLLGEPFAKFSVDAAKRGPRDPFFYRPQAVRLAPIERIGPQGLIRVERSIKILSVGAMSISLRVPFQVSNIEDLVVYHDLRFSNGTLQELATALAEDAFQELRFHCVIPSKKLAEGEAYTVFCINSPAAEARPRESAQQWLHAHRREVACLLTEELNLAGLSDQEAEESTGRHLSYYDHDLVVVDWDAALVIDEPKYFDEVLYLMELANVQLTELTAYDRILDGVIDRAYRDLSSKRDARGGGIRRELREIRIDLARFSDELSNTTKFFGDWHLARIYQAISARFHLSDWHHTIDEKLRTMDQLYELMKHDQINRWMLVLEITIVILFVIDLVLIGIGLKG